MCDQCLHPTSAAAIPRRRTKLWEIDGQWHCTIIGTCLTLGELKATATRLGVQLHSAKPSDHEVHTAMILLVKRERVVGKAVNKLLDRKHGPMVRRFDKVEGEDALTMLWQEMLAKGEVAAACWAVLSHPDATDALRNLVFGDIHMLSHQVGAASRADLRRVHALEREKAELEARIARQQGRLRGEVSRRNTVIRELRQRLDCEIAETRRLAFAAQPAEEMERLRRAVLDFQSDLKNELALRRTAEGEARQAMMVMRDLDLRLAQALQDNNELKGDLAASEGRLAAFLGSQDGVGGCSAECASLDLCGRCILFVGGRSQHLPHFRRLVEECNGTFTHHDGGFEESITKLHGLFGRADAVMFPVDCVSHSAHDEVKRLCRRWEKPFVPIRHSGMGAFIRALASVAE
ncbi:MAG: DUF2325 domain-containing protein [Phaeospirillum sp.]|nr:DUF2325 domain-containing protein [Phaeospirillum sp.]